MASSSKCFDYFIAFCFPWLQVPGPIPLLFLLFFTLHCKASNRLTRSPMYFPAFLALLSLFSVATADVTTCPSSSCDDVHLFLARGNNEPYPGRQAALVEAVCDGLSSCGYENLIYSALDTDLYCQTAYDGTIAGHTQMAAYAEQCPNSKLVLAGYSQGAQIATDILGGAGGTLYNGCVQPTLPALNISTSPGNKSE